MFEQKKANRTPKAKPPPVNDPTTTAGVPDDPRLLLEWMFALALPVTKRILTATVNRPPWRLFSGGKRCLSSQ
jgi:hypothetical protein